MCSIFREPAIILVVMYSLGMSMKKATHETDRRDVRAFEQIVNVGAATAGDFKLLGFEKPQELIGQDPEQLFTRLCKLTKCRQDPCVLDVFLATIDYMNGNPPRPWWEYTDERKIRFEHLFAEWIHV